MNFKLLWWGLCLLLISFDHQALGATKTKSKPAKKAGSSLEEVTSDALSEILDDNDEVLVLFYEDDKTPKTTKLITGLEKLDLKAYPDLPFVRCSDTAEAASFGVKAEELPDVVLFFNGTNYFTLNFCSFCQFFTISNFFRHS